MKINLLIILFLFSMGCKKQVQYNSIPGQPLSLPLNNVDNIYFATDHGLLISGVSGEKYTLIKTDANLHIEWMKNDYDWAKLIRSSGWGAAFYSIRIIKAFQNEEGNYVCIGAVLQGGDVVYSSALIIILDKNGRQLQTYNFDDERVWDALKTTDGYVLFGTQFIKLDNHFNRVWSKNIYSDNYFPSAIALTVDGGFVVTGAYKGDQAYLQKLDANGDQILVRTYKHNDYPFEESGFDIKQLPDDGFLIVGRTGEVTSYSNMINCQVIRTASNGDTIWTKRFGYSTNSWIDKIVSVDQNEFVLEGSIGFPNDSIQKTTFIKMSIDGEILKTKTTGKVPLIVHSPSNQYIEVEGDGSGRVKLSVIDAGDLFN